MRAPREFFALGARRFCKTLAIRILQRKKNLHKPLAFAQALARVVVVSSNQPTNNMTTLNYHNENETFTAGQMVTHCDDDGKLHRAVVLAVASNGLELIFEDGEEGIELPSTCFGANS
jgi:hypothetical protein